MAGFGHARARLLGGPNGWAVLAVIAALVPAIAMWGFTVDDALIPVRYARNLASGAGYRFNALGPSTDGVTPLPWPLLLRVAAAGGASALTVLIRAKYMGLVAWLLGASALGAAIGRAEAPRLPKALALVALVLSVPLAAHAVSGMETAIATTLATVAATRGERPMQASVVAGLAASLRPELGPWAVAIAVFSADGPRARLLGALVALAPFAVCALVRVLVFGRAAPLAVLAKPSDLAHGLTYAFIAALVTGGPILVLAPRALASAPRGARALAIAGAVHIAVVAAVGGDWMPYARLLVPVVPSLLLASVLLAPHARPWSLVPRGAFALGFQVYIVVVAAPAGRGVMRDRAALIDQARPYLQTAHTVAALDVGWVSAATDATIVDLAGLTDSSIAVLPGGHTSKRIDAPFLLARDPDVVVAYEPPRIVEQRLLASELIRERFHEVAVLPLAGRSYRILMKK